MRAAGAAAGQVLSMIGEHVRAGISTEELNRICHDFITRELGCIPAPLNYGGTRGFSIVREYCGHGIGGIFHDDPQVLHYGRAGTGIELQEGMTFTVEPMVNAGRADVKLLPDGWTVVTKDHSLSAQWEHTVL